MTSIINLPPQARRIVVAAAAGLALTLGTAGAIAQPGPHQHHMGGGAPFEIGHLLGEAKASLNLNTQQQAMWDAAVAQSKNAHQAMFTNRQQLKTALQTELAKPEPDLAAVAAAADNVEAQNKALRTGVRTQWLQLYATFSPDQKATVRTLMQQKVARMESFASKMREKWQAAHPAGN